MNRSFIGAVLLAMACCAGGRADEAVQGKVVVSGVRGAQALVQALKGAGATVVAGNAALDAETGVLFYDGWGNQPDDKSDGVRDRMRALLDRGGSVVFLLGGRGNFLNPFVELMPVTPWAAVRDACLRPGTGATAPEGSPLAEALKVPGFFLPGRFDLHLPYSTLETGQQRYEWERLGKPLLNTDWRVLLACDQDGRLPLLVEGRNGPGRVFVFAGDLGSPELTAWPGYAAFIKALLALARPLPVAPEASVSALSLSVPPVQPPGETLAVDVANASPVEVRAVLACKVRNFSRGLMNSVSVEIAVPAGKTVRVPVPASDPQRRAEVAAVAADAASPLRWIDAGLAAPDRRAVVSSKTVLVDQSPAVTLLATGEDVRQFPDVDGWPAGGIDYLQGGGMPLDRYVYFCGENAKVTVRLRNGFHDIAPLAKATDLSWPENPSTQGLNDGAYNYGDIRGKYPFIPYWVGRTGTDEHRLRLTWDGPVVFSRQGLLAQTAFRQRQRANPPRYALTVETEAGEKPLVSVDKAEYEFGRRQDDFPAQTATGCVLALTGLDPKLTTEPGYNWTGGNSALGEWEIYGWPAKTPPPAAKGHLTVVVRDLTSGKEKTVIDKEVVLPPVSETPFDVAVPALAHFGQAAVHAEFKPESGPALVSDFPILFVPKGAPHLVNRDELGEADLGLLCSPGFLALDDFGKGTTDATQGWGGADDQSWAWALDLKETGPHVPETAQRFFLGTTGVNHYTDPWRAFPSGVFVWDWATDQLIEKFTNGRWKGKKSLHMVLSDRWNGVPVGAQFSWDDLVRFDEWLRAAGKPGLKGRTRTALAKEILSEHGDDFQRFQMGTYADALLRSQQRLAAIGVRFTTETHGSFPLAGGDLGARLAKADTAVGTDLFWALLDEDPYKTLGYRFGLVAANPDLESGVYDQWGWVNSTLANPTWFTPSGDAEPSRRQWYTTGWEGRIDLGGTFRPYAIYGFSSQGGFGVKNTLDDWARFNRVQTAMIRVRPEKAAGFGIVASWQLQENRMGPVAGQLGFGLYTAKGYDQVDAAVGEAYQRLAKNGLPIGFVTSTHALRKWGGAQPLLVVDGFETDPWEIAEFDRLNKGGAPIFAIGSENRAGRTEAEAFFGVKKTDAGWEPVAGTEAVAAPGAPGKPLAFVCRRAGRPPVLFSPIPPAALTGPEAERLSALCIELAGRPVEVTPGVSTAAFVSNGSLFLLLGNLADVSVPIDVAVRPALLDPSLKGKDCRVVDLDSGVALPASLAKGDPAGTLRFHIVAAPNDGRMIQIAPIP